MRYPNRWNFKFTRNIGIPTLYLFINDGWIVWDHGYEEGHIYIYKNIGEKPAEEITNVFSMILKGREDERWNMWKYILKERFF